jgi:hypothetical protein
VTYAFRFLGRGNFPRSSSASRGAIFVSRRSSARAIPARLRRHRNFPHRRNCGSSGLVLAEHPRRSPNHGARRRSRRRSANPRSSGFASIRNRKGRIASPANVPSLRLPRHRVPPLNAEQYPRQRPCQSHCVALASIRAGSVAMLFVRVFVGRPAIRGIPRAAGRSGHTSSLMRARTAAPFQIALGNY